jgi:hypothetical protein
MTDETKLPFNPELSCSVSKIQVDFASHTGTLMMADGNCCDMTGCINFFLSIDPNIKRIDTYAGHEPDTCYERDYRYRWRAITPEGAKGEWQRIGKGS